MPLPLGRQLSRRVLWIFLAAFRSDVRQDSTCSTPCRENELSQFGEPSQPAAERDYVDGWIVKLSAKGVLLKA